MLSPKTALIIIASLMFLTVSFITTLPDGKLHLVFCDVGQGDAAYIRSPNGTDIIIDGGPDRRVLDCLGKHMPFYDRKIELLILSHPQADHLTGLIEILKYYHVSQIVDSSANSASKEYEVWENLIEEKKIRKIIASQGERIVVDNNIWFDIVWPPENPDVSLQKDINLLSTVVLLKYQNFSGFFTGDISKEVAEKLNLSINNPVTVLKVPHHGSKYGLSQKFLEDIRPKLAVISVGKNSFGHPSHDIIKLLNPAESCEARSCFARPDPASRDSLNIPTLRTDKDGEIEIIIDSIGWKKK